MSAPRRRLSVVAAAALLAAPCIGAGAGAQLFKCVDGGRTVYQQQACAVSTQPEVAASAPRIGAKASAAVADAAPVPTRKIRSPASPASSAPAKPR
ncbi:MAG: hypothetical protein ABIQ33_13285 [Caldimonas sp.]